MSKIHLIFDFQYMYYRCFFSLKSGVLKRLSYEVGGEEIDTSELYYVMGYIESERKKFEGNDKEITVSICFDSKTNRREDDNYKSNRKDKPKENKLTQEDFDKIDRIREMCRNIGYNTYKCEGYEADDLVASLVKQYKEEFDYTVIYTTDKDILINIDDKVGVMRYKTNLKNHVAINKTSYSEIISKEFGCHVPYNTIGLYLCLVGDTTDSVKGVKGFGKKAFDKLIKEVSYQGFEELGDYDKVEQFIKDNENLIGVKNNPDSLEQALHSLKLVRSYIVELEKPVKSDTQEKRLTELHKYGIHLADKK